ncbi:MAG: DUF4136 domain-containing protein [Bacteroidota bacterium]
MLNRSFILIFFLIVSACSSIRVKTVYDEKFDFDQLKSFCWMNGCEFNIDGPAYLSSDTAIVHSFMREIKSNLEGKGFKYDDETPDFVINLHVVAFEKEAVNYSPYHIYSNEDDYGPWLPESYQYLEGSLIIDIANYDTSQLVWRSDVMRYTDIGPRFSERTIKRVVQSALKQFPPQKEA